MIPWACKDPALVALIKALEKASDAVLLAPDDAISGAVDVDSHRAFDPEP